MRIEDFSELFGYRGIVDQFFETYLKDTIDTARRPWQGRVAHDVRLSRNAIAAFERAQTVKETFFRGDKLPYVMRLTPLGGDQVSSSPSNRYRYCTFSGTVRLIPMTSKVM